MLKKSQDKLKNDVTIVIADTFNHKLATHAISESVRQTGIKNVVVFSDKNLYKNSTHVKINLFKESKDYSAFVLKNISQYVETSHILVTGVGA